MLDFIRSVIWKFRGIKVFALVGKSGTGKSFRAKLVMERHGIEMMIDDGLLIRENRIIAGRSAKRESAYLSAVKTALFTNRDHAREVRHRIEKERFTKLLILGTSERMIHKICETLRLPSPSKIIQIEDIATREEIRTAINYRKSHGQHVIPVPSIEVKRTYPRIMADSIRVFLKRGFGLFKKENVFEKSVVRPEFSKRGSVTISEGALSQMVLHCIDEYAPGLQLLKMTVKNSHGGYRLHLAVGVPFGEELSNSVHDLQTYIITRLEKYTGIIVADLSITIEMVDAIGRISTEKKHKK